MSVAPEISARATGRTDRRRTDRLLGLSGLLPFVLLLTEPPSPTLLSYSLFVAVYLMRSRLGRLVGRGPVPVLLALVPLTVVSGLFTELFAWTDSYLHCEPGPALFHPQLGPDLIHGIGFYASWGLAWSLLLRRYRFRLGEVFAVQGLYGVLVEQQGSVALTGLVTLPAGLILWGFVMLIYGATAATPYALIVDRLQLGQRSDHWSKYPIALVSLGLCLALIGLAWGAVIDATGWLPARQPICARPFW